MTSTHTGQMRTRLARENLGRELDEREYSGLRVRLFFQGTIASESQVLPTDIFAVTFQELPDGPVHLIERLVSYETARHAFDHPWIVGRERGTLVIG